MTIGFIGLGNIGRPIAAAMAAKGMPLVVYDVAAAAERAPEGTRVASDLRVLAAESELVFLCLPSSDAGRAVAAEFAMAEKRPTHVVDTSTVGPSGAESLASEFAAMGVTYVDAPVSGGVARARTGELTSMVACSQQALHAVRPAILGYSSKIVPVGTTAGQAQAMKLVNNYASIACMLSTSEAISYGLSRGLGMDAMLEVMNGSSGQSFVSSTLFPRHIANGKFDSAAPARIVHKDLGLFVREVHQAGTAHAIADQALALFDAYEPASPDEDWLRIFEFIRGRATPR
jgi:3-hydroxyisobutyrate dehydrogenase-like beta-hydroxyacid dehydrogenase